MHEYFVSLLLVKKYLQLRDLGLFCVSIKGLHKIVMH